MIVEIDMDRPENQKPEQNLESNEIIKVLFLENLGPNSLQEAIRLCEEKNYSMSSGLYRFLAGLAMINFLKS